MTKRELMNWLVSDAVRNIVSMQGQRRALVAAIWNSYSKSETARRPRMITAAPWLLREGHQQGVERVDLEPAAVDAIAVHQRLGLVLDQPHAVVEREHRVLADVDRDREDQPVDHLGRAPDDVEMPLWIGSKVPG